MEGKKDKKHLRLFETKYFSFVIAAIIIILLLLVNNYTSWIKFMELKMADRYLNLNSYTQSTTNRKGVEECYFDEKRISKDIEIIGIDFKSLTKIGKWPFPRHVEASIVNAFSRIQNTRDRERALFLDIFFIEPDKKAFDDILLINSIKENGRVFLETVLDEEPIDLTSIEEFFDRQEILYKNCGEIKNIKGDWKKIITYYGLQPPLKPYAEVVHGYGHANFQKDFDNVYRRQTLVTRSAELIGYYTLDDFTPDFRVNEEELEHIEWIDKKGRHHLIPYPLTEKSIAVIKRKIKNNSPSADDEGKLFYFYKYKNHLVPAVTLSLALEYLNKDYSDIVVIPGKYIIIPEPEYFDTETQKWIPYSGASILDDGKREIRIPIDSQGNMRILYNGPSSAIYNTFKLRSFAGYSTKDPGTDDPSAWRKTLMAGNKILMVGPYARGMAEDEKTTPFGPMYGVEIHANALNNILMNNFLKQVPLWFDLSFCLFLIFLFTILTSRFSTIVSLICSFISIFLVFILAAIYFDTYSTLINFSNPALGIFFTFISITVYRTMTEERDKKRIKIMFGRYVSPDVVDQLMENPPELGGVDKNLSVLFSDIRGFTTLSESMTPQELVNHLNIYLTAMTDIIFEYHGYLDKYVGDEIMCFWGAPMPQENHAILACKCALKQMEALARLNESWVPERRIDIGIGINSGIMTVGNMGSPDKLNYTLMGDNVNLGARLEGTNKQYKTNIIISENTYGIVKNNVIVRELDNIRVKGKNKPVMIYELLDCDYSLE